MQWLEEMELRIPQDLHPADDPRLMEHALYSVETTVIQAKNSSKHLADVWNIISWNSSSTLNG